MPPCTRLVQAAATFLFTWRIMKTVEQEGLGGVGISAGSEADRETKEQRKLGADCRTWTCWALL